MLNPLETVISELKVTLRCRHAQTWPPVQAKLDEPLERQRARGLISEQKYEQVRVWERVCGQLQMGEKCLTCPMAETPMSKGGGRWQPFNESTLYQALRPFIK